MRERLFAKIAGFELGPSHDFNHLEKTLEYALLLHEKYGGDKDILTAAAILHDTGRSNKSLHGQDSADESVRIAKGILQSVSFPEDKIVSVCTAIAEHDKPGGDKSSIESLILQEADFLAGFGATGILRLALWTGESGGGYDKAIDRLKNKMSQRAASLKFPESRLIAQRQLAFAELFVAMLDKDSTVERIKLPGKYIVIEGVGGSGKNTCANALHHQLAESGVASCVVTEPARSVSSTTDNLLAELMMFSADRVKLMDDEVTRRMELGETVIGVRSFVSSMVYQSKNDFDQILTRFLHTTFVPEPNLIVLLDVLPEVALDRINDRGDVVDQKLKLIELSDRRAKYISVIDKFQEKVIIDANQSIDKVVSDVMKELSAHQLLK